jgi:glutamine synthetase
MQGPYYCAVGSESVYGRPLVEAHLEACMACGINISGVNAEVMPGQWEFQVGPSGPLDVADEVRGKLYFLGSKDSYDCKGK